MAQRELKFRVWDRINKEMIPASDVPWIEASISGKFINLLTVSFLDGEKKGLIPQQFTGLKDKNNKDIFEGDIVKRENWDKIYYVRYSKDGYFWCGTHEDDKRFYQVRDCLYDNDRLRNGLEGCEIIGNIFENPELLEN